MPWLRCVTGADVHLSGVSRPSLPAAHPSDKIAPSSPSLVGDDGSSSVPGGAGAIRRRRAHLASACHSSGTRFGGHGSKGRARDTRLPGREGLGSGAKKVGASFRGGTLSRGFMRGEKKKPVSPPPLTVVLRLSRVSSASQVKKFASKVMKTSDVRVDVKLNKAIWSKGIRNVRSRLPHPPHTHSPLRNTLPLFIARRNHGKTLNLFPSCSRVAGAPPYSRADLPQAQRRRGRHGTLQTQTREAAAVAGSPRA